MRSVRIQAHAKVNLGLAILGKRQDGYHEIDTILAMIDLADTITVHEVSEPGITIAGQDDVPVETNLITRAIQDWCHLTGQHVAYHVDVQKRIPSPAGLGGGSSDAAATLRALRMLDPNRLTSPDIVRLASRLGADCPFFLGSVCARATGIGTTLSDVEAPKGWVVIIVPPVHLQSKTATLYAALTTHDYGHREQIDEIQRGLVEPQLGTFVNSFTRPALEAFTELRVATDALTLVAGGWSLSGAGPATFAVTPEQREALGWSDELRSLLPPSFRILHAPFLQTSPVPEQLV